LAHRKAFANRAKINSLLNRPRQWGSSAGTMLLPGSPEVCSLSMGDTLEQWFIREVLAHEGALMRHLSRVWPNRSEIRDIRQEAYVRVYEAARRARPMAPKSFLFATARNLMTDRMRRERVVCIEARGELDALNVLVDEISPERRTSAHEELARLARAFERLPLRCREVMWLTKVENLSQQEVASRLGVQEKAVEKQVSRGIRLLAAALFGERAELETRNSNRSFARATARGQRRGD
jgi:RNA polymerase sigma factor (sigma-70 family)